MIIRFKNSFSQLENIDEVTECLAIGQKWQNDERIVLFVVLQKGKMLTPDLINQIKRHIRTHTTPRHVPAKIIDVVDLPRTKNNKLAEIAVRDIVHGRAIKNKEALLNPECLGIFANIRELQEE